MSKHSDPCLRSVPGSAARISVPTKLGYSSDCFGNANLRLISADRTTESQCQQAFRAPIWRPSAAADDSSSFCVTFLRAALAVRSPRGQRGGRKRLAPGRGCSFLQRGSRRRQIITSSSRTASTGGNKLFPLTQQSAEELLTPHRGPLLVLLVGSMLPEIRNSSSSDRHRGPKHLG